MMYKVDNLILITGSDIIIPYYEVKIHQPNIREIALIGEEKFLFLLNLFVTNEEKLKELLINNIVDLSVNELQEINNLNLLETIMLLIHLNIDYLQDYINFFKLLLNEANIYLDEDGYHFTAKDLYNNIIEIDNNLFIIIKEIIEQIFILDKLFNTEQKYNPINEKANKIAKKMEKNRIKIESQNHKEQESNGFLSNMISILGIVGYTILDSNNLTLYQLYNQFNRYILYMSYNQSLKAALTGAKVEITDWFQVI